VAAIKDIANNNLFICIIVFVFIVLNLYLILGYILLFQFKLIPRRKAIEFFTLRSSLFT